MNQDLERESFRDDTCRYVSGEWLWLNKLDPDNRSWFLVVGHLFYESLRNPPECPAETRADTG